MREIGAGEAERRMSQLLEWVEAGEEVTITRSGRAVARLLPVAPIVDMAQAREAIAGIRAMRKGATLAGLKIKDLVNEGRP